MLRMMVLVSILNPSTSDFEGPKLTVPRSISPRKPENRNDIPIRNHSDKLVLVSSTFSCGVTYKLFHSHSSVPFEPPVPYNHARTYTHTHTHGQHPEQDHLIETFEFEERECAIIN
ncbi:hypothetical protein GWI33_017769 [Rhynchophorus ferrugineus]|uniref:Uncharacterized protein n=1 Tax=Rhynchophorus ferrugineus TaxID=354439 RepID=A0A834HZ37_RHYFE|nr:hypothetical protein GWI33_017769 [Rhynchophorus ferrugineus]